MPYSHGVRFEPEVPFVNLRSRLTSTAHIKQLDSHRSTVSAGLRISPGLEAGDALARYSTVSTRRLQNSSVVKKLFRDSP